MVLTAGLEGPPVVFAIVVQFTTDMPAGDKLLNAVGGNGEHPGRFRDFPGVWHKRRYCYPPYARDDPPPSNRRGFQIRGNTIPWRTAASLAASARAVESARRSGARKATVSALVHQEGIKGCSLSFCSQSGGQGPIPSVQLSMESRSGSAAVRDNARSPAQHLTALVGAVCR